MGEVGFEYAQKTAGNTVVSQSGGAESGADDAGWHIPAAQDDPDLKTLIESWSGLPIEIRAGIMLISSPYRSHFR